MDFSMYSGTELVRMYGELLVQMREKNIIRSKNVTGDLGEYLVIDHYTKTKGLPKLQFAPPSTKNIDAISVEGDRYSIKTTTTNATGAFYGLAQDADSNMRPMFEYVVVVKLDDMYQPELILELDWDAFFRHKHLLRFAAQQGQRASHLSRPTRVCAYQLAYFLLRGQYQ